MRRPCRSQRNRRSRSASEGNVGQLLKDKSLVERLNKTIASLQTSRTDQPGQGNHRETDQRRGDGKQPEREPERHQRYVNKASSFAPFSVTAGSISRWGTMAKATSM